MTKSRNMIVNGKESRKTVTKKMVKAMIESTLEMKEFAFAITNGNDYTTSGLVYNVTGFVIQGDDIGNRTGDMITLRSLKMGWNSVNGQGTAVPTTFRSILFYDTKGNGTTPLVTDVLDTANYLAGYNSINKQQNRFHVIFDKTVDAVALTNSATKTLEVSFKQNRKVYYQAATNVTAAVGRNQLFHLLISRTASAGQITNSTYFTLRYNDA